MSEKISAETLKAKLEHRIAIDIDQRRKEFINVIHLTDLLGCPYRKMRYKQGVFIRENKAMAVWRGRSLHGEIEKVLSEIFKDGEKEKTVSVQFLIEGRAIDLYLTPDFLTKDYVMEIKTVKRLRRDREFNLKEPFDHDLAQLKAYVSLLDKQDGFLVYYELSENKFTVFRISLTESRRKAIREIIARKLERWVKGEYPKKSEYDWECRFCEFKKECFAGV